MRSPMRVVVCAKQVLDPDTVDAYAVAGRLEVDPNSGELLARGIVRLMNAYDEQAIETALRIRDAGVDCMITVVTLGDESSRRMLQSAYAMGADEAVIISDAAYDDCDGLAIAKALSQAIDKLDGADLVLCGREASDDDQGVVGPALSELLGASFASIARNVAVESDETLHVTRVTLDGDEIVALALPALVTVSNEVGDPRMPGARAMMQSRRKSPTVWSAADLGMDAGDVRSHVRQVGLAVREVHGDCEFMPDASVVEQAAALATRLREDGVI